MAANGPDPEQPTHDYRSGRTDPSAAAVPTTPVGNRRTRGPTPTTVPDQPLPRGFLPVFGDYELLHLAGEGGMGLVYQARHRPSGRLVALKLIRAGAAGSPDLVARFLREVRTADAARHPNIIPVLDAGEVNGRVYYTMPYVPGHLGRRRADYDNPRAAARLLATLARAVHHVHTAAGVVHRDLKPGNVLLAGDGTPLIADFGLARWAEESQALTQTGLPLGTPPYMSPEQAAGRAEHVGPGADIWALGVILYELVTGERPFDGASRDATLTLIKTTEPPTPRQFRPALDPPLEAVILKCLRKVPAERYTTAAALADDLECWLDGRPVRAARETAAPAVTAAPAAPNRPRWAVAALVGLIPLLLAGWFGAGVPADRSRDALVSGSPVTGRDKRQEIEQLLAAGWSVEVIPDTGWPLWSERLSGDTETLLISSAAGRRGTRISHDGLGLVALVRDPQSDSFRIEADVLHREGSGPDTFVGLFFGYTICREDGANWRGHFQWGLNDQYDRAEGLKAAPPPKEFPKIKPVGTANDALWQFIICRHNRWWRKSSLCEPRWDASFVPARRTPDRNVWRHLAIDVRRSGVEVSLDHRPVGSHTLDALRKKLAAAFRSGDVTPAPLAVVPRAPAGVVVDQATADFRSFRITPLHERD
jgi:Protein kinase domain